MAQFRIHLTKLKMSDFNLDDESVSTFIRTEKTRSVPTPKKRPIHQISDVTPVIRSKFSISMDPKIPLSKSTPPRLSPELVRRFGKKSDDLPEDGLLLADATFSIPESTEEVEPKSIRVGLSSSRMSPSASSDEHSEFFGDYDESDSCTL